MCEQFACHPPSFAPSHTTSKFHLNFIHFHMWILLSQASDDIWLEAFLSSFMIIVECKSFASFAITFGRKKSTRIFRVHKVHKLKRSKWSFDRTWWATFRFCAMRWFCGIQEPRVAPSTMRRPLVPCNRAMARAYSEFDHASWVAIAFHNAMWSSKWSRPHFTFVQCGPWVLYPISSRCCVLCFLCFSIQILNPML